MRKTRHASQEVRCGEVLAAVKVLFFLSILACSEPKSTLLFQADEPESWIRSGPAHLRFSNGEIEIASDSGMSFIMTSTIMDDFEMMLDFFPDSTVNSGIFIRCPQQSISATDCYELNIWDLHPNQDFRTGAVVTKAKPLVHVNTLNQWNTFRILAKEGRIQAWINGQLTADLKNQGKRSGHIALQGAGKGIVRFRKVQLLILSD